MKKLIWIGISCILLSTSLFSWSIYNEERDGDSISYSLKCNNGNIASIEGFDGFYVTHNNGHKASRNFNEIASHACGE